MTAQSGQNVVTLERKINLVTVKSISMTNLRDDWLVRALVPRTHTTLTLMLQALNLGPTEEGDPLISCVFKTEFVTHMMTLTQARIQLTVAPTYVG